MLLHARLVGGVGLGGEHDLLSLCTQSRSDHALVVSVGIAARGIEIVDSGIGGALDDAAIRGDHAAEADGGYLQPSVAEHFVIEFYLLPGSLCAGGICVSLPGWAKDTQF